MSDQIAAIVLVYHSTDVYPFANVFEDIALAESDSMGNPSMDGVVCSGDEFRTLADHLHVLRSVGYFVGHWLTISVLATHRRDNVQSLVAGQKAIAEATIIILSDGERDDLLYLHITCATPLSGHRGATQFTAKISGGARWGGLEEVALNGDGCCQLAAVVGWLVYPGVNTVFEFAAEVLHDATECLDVHRPSPFALGYLYHIYSDSQQVFGVTEIISGEPL